MSNRAQILNLQIPKLDEVADRLSSIEAQLTDFKSTLDAIQKLGEKMDADIQAIIDQAQKNTDAESAAVGALNALFAKLVAALAGTGPISAADRVVLQAKVKAMADSADAVAAAIVADTPADAPPAG